MTNISSLPPEVLLHIFSLVPDSDLTSVVRTCAQWARILASRIQSSWACSGHWPRAGEVQCAAALVTSGYLPEDVMTTCAMKIQTSWSNPGYWPSDVEVQCADALVTSGYLPEDVVTPLATRIQDSWPSPTPAIQGHRVEWSKNL